MVMPDPQSDEQRNTLIPRERGDDIDITVRFRKSAFDRLTATGLCVNGVMQLDKQPDGTYAIVVWSPAMPDWPDPVPGNEDAAEERSRS